MLSSFSQQSQRSGNHTWLFGHHAVTFININIFINITDITYTPFRCVAVRQVGPRIWSSWAEQPFFVWLRQGALSCHWQPGDGM